MYLKPPRTREAFRKRNVQAKPTQKAKFPAQRDRPCISGSSENARLGGWASVKGRRYLFSLKIRPLTLFLAYNRAEQVDYLGSRTESIISSIGKIYLLRGTSCTLWWRHMERTRPLWSPLLLHSPPTSTSWHKSFKSFYFLAFSFKAFSRAPNYILFWGCCISWQYPGIPRQFFQYFI